MKRELNPAEKKLIEEVLCRTQLDCSPEYRFHPTRKWRLDLAWPEVRVAVEIQGGVYVRGKHVQGDGAEKDYEKLNEAQLLGWIVLQTTPRGLALPAFLETVLWAVRLQREQLADWMPGDTVTLAADPGANERAGRAMDHLNGRNTDPSGDSGG